MKSSIVLAMFATATLLACGKTDEVSAPATEAPPAVEPAPVETPVTTQPAAGPVAPADTVTAPPSVPPQTAAKPVPPSAAKPAPIAPAMPAPAKAPEAAPPAPKPDLARGEQVYRQSCAVCHDKGVAGAPKAGDAAAWSPRLARGMDAMYATALNGKGAMPAKGGNPSLSEPDVKSAVDYLAAQSR